MGRKKEADIGTKKKVNSYTQERLQKLVEKQLGGQEIEIRAGYLKDNMFCHYEYDHTVAANTTDNIKRKSQVPVHEDMITAFSDLDVHLAVIWKEINPEEIKDIDNLPELIEDLDLDDPGQDKLAVMLSKFSVNAFKIVGSGENEGVVLIGQKQLDNYENGKLETPVVKWQSDYPFVNELHVAVFNAVEEIEQYMQGKQAPPKQQELNFEVGVDGEVRGIEEDEVF
ncbi:hypothetical protein [Chitinophaga tropicalis]|uniref:Uncharacterized protein n=1 Tax=Chitinophaga tropicalis TaxID=2683588 RepID=A0A7K1UAF7_9BACT|nr:hypothetical protein [Chitinophaga tropicalis]MVT11349.1 hypothetical protein [Chitinophaga tropicalis]